MGFGVTNLTDDRFYCIMHHLRVEQFHYPQKMLQIKKQFRCRACNEIGHNKKNKNVHYTLTMSNFISQNLMRIISYDIYHVY